MGEKNRLETTLREEETRVRKEEADLKLAEQAFDNFLQENDRKAMEAQKKVSFNILKNIFSLYNCALACSIKFKKSQLHNSSNKHLIFWYVHIVIFKLH